MMWMVPPVGRRSPAMHSARSLCQRRGRGGFCADGSHHMAVPQHGHPIGDLLLFLELVADEDNCASFLRKTPDGLEELLRLGGSQDGGRFIQDQYPGIAKEQLEYLKPLLISHGALA